MTFDERSVVHRVEDVPRLITYEDDIQPERERAVRCVAEKTLHERKRGQRRGREGLG